ncbi:ornithine aminotransferase [Dyadobacter beijingensis]|uniref:Ornithine aminotransferase n=1 Tax=Dyadobacter beijingensis TaxID=365489 RepID=A0ABQ2HW18_9BACT|nr:BON domain-containing protein [Dyadobacter beijingensis]GGM89849.1 ornithine aminotransferase [Dyadobacter beijingensis]
MKTNEDLQRDVCDAIRWEPLLRETDIGVTARDGVISLTGTVDTYGKKSEAEEAARRVEGVKMVTGQLSVKPKDETTIRDDTDLANEILNAYQWTQEIPSDRVTVKVENGWITLEGDLQWNYQRDAAERLIGELPGVKGMSNNIRIKYEPTSEIDKAAIESAFTRSSSITQEGIRVRVVKSKVILTGTVSSCYEKDEAARQAWKAPGVEIVYNELIVEQHPVTADS